MADESSWSCAGCGRPVCRTWGAAAAVRAAGQVTVRIRVYGACAAHVAQVQRLLSAEVTSGGEVLVVADVQRLRPRHVARWATAMRSELVTAAESSPLAV